MLYHVIIQGFRFLLFYLFGICFVFCFTIVMYVILFSTQNLQQVNRHNLKEVYYYGIQTQVYTCSKIAYNITYILGCGLRKLDVAGGGTLY